jgi:hypothetical protein
MGQALFNSELTNIRVGLPHKVMMKILIMARTIAIPMSRSGPLHPTLMTRNPMVTRMEEDPGAGELINRKAPRVTAQQRNLQHSRIQNLARLILQSEFYPSPTWENESHLPAYSLVKFDGMRFKGRIEPLRSMPKGFTGDDKDVLAKFVFYYTSAGTLYGMLLYFPIFNCLSFILHSHSKTAH